MGKLNARKVAALAKDEPRKTADGNGLYFVVPASGESFLDLAIFNQRLSSRNDNWILSRTIPCRCTRCGLHDLFIC